AGPRVTAGLVDIVPAERTVLVTTRPGTDLVALRADLLALLSAGEAGPGVDTVAGEARLVTIPVRYDGPDLDDVARHTGLTVAEVTAAHEASHWEVAFCGFVPGFAYLVGGDPRLEVPRRSTPRTVVPAGAVALAGRYSGIYPRPSPGGWQLIGSTSAVLFDPHRESPALLRPGDRVRFVASPA
ncbi:MAG: carboxyltransferase domain-containing protein, partial [Candidatus Lutibacillus vidarii]